MVAGRYHIDRLIAQGGFGAVYEATDTRLRVRVAIKHAFVSAKGDGFRREAELLAQLQHPCLPKVSDWFTEEALGHFLVMEYIPGDDLETQIIAHGTGFPVEIVREWARDLIDVLTYLHGRPSPIIHRDIKPRNLKLSADGRIVLLDFGLAKGDLAGLTIPLASRAGYTAEYSPLEQIRGVGTDARSDLYALAATLYRLLSGELPADALTRAAAAVTRQSDPLRPIEQLVPKIPGPMAQAITHALASDPSARPLSARGFGRMLLAVETETKPAVVSPRPIIADLLDIFLLDVWRYLRHSVMLIVAAGFAISILRNTLLTDITDGTGPGSLADVALLDSLVFWIWIAAATGFVIYVVGYLLRLRSDL